MFFHKSLTRIPSTYLVISGNFLEFFDLFLYIHLAHIINKHFIPDYSLSYIENFGLAIIYLIAPIASVFFGFFGDLFGRKKVVLVCSFLMALSTLGILLLPSYETIGPISGIIFMTVRLFQGLSLAGDGVVNSLYMVEQSNSKKIPLYISFIVGTECLGGAFALILGYLTLTYDLSWRTPFVAAFLFVIFSFFLRNHLEESEEYQKVTTIVQKNRFSVKEAIEFYNQLNFKNKNLICYLLIAGITPIAFVTSFLYLGKHLREVYEYTFAEVMIHNCCIALAEGIILVFLGYIVSKYSFNIRSNYFVRLLIGGGVAYFLPWLISAYDSPLMIGVIQLTLMVCSAFFMISGSIMKTYYVVGRFSLAAFSYLGNRVITFFVVTFLMTNIFEHFSFEGIKWIYILACIFAAIGTYFHVSANEKDEFVTSNILRNNSTLIP